MLRQKGEIIMYDAAESLAVVIAIFLVIILLAGVFGIGWAITEGITSIWQKELVCDTFEVEILEKSMNDNYKILVKGIDLNGEEYCKTHVVFANEYANMNPGDILLVRQRVTTQPLFGEKVSYTLIKEVVVPSVE